MPLPTAEQLKQAAEATVLDGEGKELRFGDLTKDHKVAVLFIRHFFIVIGCGAFKLIEKYKQLTKWPYGIYTDPSLELYKIFNFVRNLDTSKPGVESKAYEKDLGSLWTRTWSTVKVGFGTLGSPLSMGPKDQNGGEMVVEEDGTCSWFHRMEHTADHADIADVARALGVEHTPVTAELHSVKCETGVKV